MGGISYKNDHERRYVKRRDYEHLKVRFDRVRDTISQYAYRAQRCEQDLEKQMMRYTALEGRIDDCCDKCFRDGTLVGVAVSCAGMIFILVITGALYSVWG